MPDSANRRPSALAAHEWFFAGGQYVERETGTFMAGQMYVERFVPVQRRHDTPVVMIHGGGQTGTNFLATADGRPGWLHDFLDAGYEVYVADQPERGRSGHALHAGATAQLNRYSTARIEQQFTAIANSALWPQARHHTQWPGKGVRGDAFFDRFYASQVELLEDRAAAGELKPALSASSDDAELVTGYLPSCEARTLPNLAGIPIAIVTAQCSYHACYDHCTSAFLNWAGVHHDFIRLHNRGLSGNGHMAMLEKNSHEIAALLLDWLGTNVSA